MPAKNARHIAINGELGSGKSAIARALASYYGMELVSTGDVQRTIARSLNLSTLETNLLAEKDEMIDARVDSITKELAESDHPIVFDSRMAWQMVPESFKVHLIVDPSTAAKRLYHERSSAVEGYTSVIEAQEAAEKRYQSERKRFITKYDADVSHLRNYHLVVDTTDASIDQIAAQIRASYEAAELSALRLLVSPMRVIPGREPAFEASDDQYGDDQHGDDGPGSLPSVGYARPFLFALNGQEALGNAIRTEERLVPARLLAEGSEIAAQGLSAEDYLRAIIRPTWIAAWEQHYGIRLPSYPRSSRV